MNEIRLVACVLSACCVIVVGCASSVVVTGDRARVEHSFAPGADDAAVFRMTARSRRAVEGSGDVEVVERVLAWDAKETAVVLCDVWDSHWCAGARRRLDAMVPRMNEVVKRVRSQGGLIVHAPSDTMKFYENAPQRRLAMGAPRAEPPSLMKGWNHLDPTCEGPLPIDDSDGGCDCEPQCGMSKGAPWPWTRQHPGIEVMEGDAVTDNGQEVFNLFKQRGIKQVLVIGVHTNMCVLGRSFAIRQLVRWNFDVALVRDLTDTMYNPRKPPRVSHDKGTELVVAHVERYWCPTVVSTDIVR
jgi:nicotinamidase-related amidase